jgi:hypothetical protein
VVKFLLPYGNFDLLEIGTGGLEGTGLVTSVVEEIAGNVIGGTFIVYNATW